MKHKIRYGSSCCGEGATYLLDLLPHLVPCVPSFLAYYALYRPKCPGRGPKPEFLSLTKRFYQFNIDGNSTQGTFLLKAFEGKLFQSQRIQKKRLLRANSEWTLPLPFL